MNFKYKSSFNCCSFLFLWSTVVAYTMWLPEVISDPQVQQVDCHCVLPRHTTCSPNETCRSLSNCCEAIYWFLGKKSEFLIKYIECSNKVSPGISHAHGSEAGDVVFSVTCCGQSTCNIRDIDNFESTVLPRLCYYSQHVDDSHYGILTSFLEYCEQFPESAPFSRLEFVILLCTPIALLLCCFLCFLIVYIRKVRKCSLANWKAFVISLCFHLPLCLCLKRKSGDGRSNSRNSDDPQQPLFDVGPTWPKPTDQDGHNRSNLSHDSGCPNDGVQKLGDNTGNPASNRYSPLTPSFSTQSNTRNGPPVPSFIVSSVGETIGEVSNSGSGGGQPVIGACSMASQTTLLNVIGQGRYGVVYRAEIMGDLVAVKIFQSRDERAYDRERQIYMTRGMQHDAVLAFRGADSRDTGLTTQLWLFTEYHPLGSLYDFLTNSDQGVTWPVAYNLLYSLTAGVAHLHIEMRGSPGKPAIAHRDLKSRNILVKNGPRCCLADFGFAVTFSSVSKELDQSPVTSQSFVGTRRYMSNEMLDGSADLKQFSSFTSADIYAHGLVMWEILRRTQLHPTTAAADPPQLPFAEYNIGADPTHAEMMRVVCIEKLRPTMPARFTFQDDDHSDDDAIETSPPNSPSRQIASSLGSLVTEMWQETPSARPSALGVKKTLNNYVVKLQNSFE